MLLGFFWQRLGADRARPLALAPRPRDRADDTDAQLGWLLVVGTIPAGLIGLLLEHPLRHLFASPQSAAFFLMVNGFLLLRRRAPAPRARPGRRAAATPTTRDRARLSWREALGVGAAQALALIPGISRSGATMGGGLLVGLSNEDAARFAFLLATPIIGAAARAQAARPVRVSRATACAGRRWWGRCARRRPTSRCAS